MLARIAGAVACVVAIGMVLVYGHYRTALSQPVLEAGETETVVIPEGADWSETVGALRRAGLVEYDAYFEIWARWSELPRDVKAGTYHFEGPLAMRRLGRRLREGGVSSREVRITIPEGWTIYHIADWLADKGLVGREAFLEAVRDPELLEEFEIPGKSFEGYLYPDTYRFAENATVEHVVRKMHERWREVWEEVRRQNGESLETLRQIYGFDRHEVVVLASLVEAESRVESERGIIARVMLNRLDEDMRLQTDPTCVYGPDSYKKVPTPSMCNDPSNRYSTYVNDGLPPGPIGNPGRGSLEAAIAPATGKEVERYLFFVARQDGTGEHAFSKTYREHRRMVRKYLK